MLERTRTHEQPQNAVIGGLPGGDPLADTRRRLTGMTDAADAVLDVIRPVISAEYLEQNYQLGAE